jgi:hypothetical protein
VRGLTALERRILEPGRPGETAPDNVLEQLARDGRARWVPCGPKGDRVAFEPTELGQLALRVCPVER